VVASGIEGMLKGLKRARVPQEILDKINLSKSVRGLKEL
jgi:hypothetical protein